MNVVVKIGGELLRGGEAAVLAVDLAALAKQGERIVVVHGGGPQATELSTKLGLPTKQIGGRRVTDHATLDVMKMVVAGQLNVDLCALLTAAGARPVGLHSAVRATRRPPKVISGGGPEPVDLGFVGDVVDIDMDLLASLLDAGYTPVLACLGVDPSGQVYNINADIVGNQVAAEIHADHLALVTSTPGVLRDVKDPASRLTRLTVAEAQAAIADGTVSGGMIPKLEESIAVLGDGVGAVHILGKLGPGDLARALRAPGTVGTTLVP